MQALQVYICNICKSYCDSEYCYSCEKELGELVDIKYQKEIYIEKITSIINSLKQTSINVMLSEFGDSPCEIATVEFEKDELISLLVKYNFIFNDITAIKYNGKVRECVGLAILDPFEIDNFKENVAGMMVFTE